MLQMQHDAVNTRLEILPTVRSIRSDMNQGGRGTNVAAASSRLGAGGIWAGEPTRGVAISSLVVESPLQAIDDGEERMYRTLRGGSVKNEFRVYGRVRGSSKL